MIFADFTKLSLPPKVLRKLEAATEEINRITDASARNKYIDGHSKYWTATLPSLAEITNCTDINCLCWYCECDGAAGFYFHVDHFRPKKRVNNKTNKNDECEPGYWWLAFKPENYRISCQRCNTGAGKNDQFPLQKNSTRAICSGGEKTEKPMLLDPRVEYDTKLLCFSEDGGVHASPNSIPEEKERVDISISVYDLKARSKREARRDVWTECREKINEARTIRNKIKESILAQDNEKELMIQQFKISCGKIEIMTKNNSRFSSTAKSCIKDYYKIENIKAYRDNIDPDLEWLIDLL